MDFMKQFLDSEIMDLETYKSIYDFISSNKFRFGEYQGNQYVIRKEYKIYIQIEDEVTTKNTGIPHVETFHRDELLHILKNYKEII